MTQKQEILIILTHYALRNQNTIKSNFHCRIIIVRFSKENDPIDLDETFYLVVI